MFSIAFFFLYILIVSANCKTACEDKYNFPKAIVVDNLCLFEPTKHKYEELINEYHETDSIHKYVYLFKLEKAREVCKEYPQARVLQLDASKEEMKKKIKPVLASMRVGKDSPLDCYLVTRWPWDDTVESFDCSREASPYEKWLLYITWSVASAAVIVGFSSKKSTSRLGLICQQNFTFTTTTSDITPIITTKDVITSGNTSDLNTDVGIARDLTNAVTTSGTGISKLLNLFLNTAVIFTLFKA